MKKILKNPSTSISLKSLPEKLEAHAYAKWSYDKTKIVVDPNRVGVVRAVIHELLHIVLDDALWAIDTDLEECCIRGLEDDIYVAIEVEGKLPDWISLIEARRKDAPSSTVYPRSEAQSP